MTKSNNLLGQTNKLITNLSISHLVKYPDSYSSEDTTKRYPMIIAFHGHGSNEKDLIGLAPHLPSDILWVSGRGLQTLREGSYDWYQLPPTPAKIAATLQTINLFIEELITTYPIDPSQIYILGFSQGSMISLSYVMAYPERIAGVIAQSGAIPASIGLPIAQAGLKDKPVIITHGIEDAAMPISRGRQTRDILLELGAEVDYNEFHMGHSINNESLAAVKEWLKIKL